MYYILSVCTVQSFGNLSDLSRLTCATYLYLQLLVNCFCNDHLNEAADDVNHVTQRYLSHYTSKAVVQLAIPLLVYQFTNQAFVPGVFNFRSFFFLAKFNTFFFSCFFFLNICVNLVFILKVLNLYALRLCPKNQTNFQIQLQKKKKIKKLRSLISNQI